jgi:hypothetical protein
MSSGSGSCIGRKGRNQDDQTMRAQMSRVANNQPKYGNSELLLRLNNLVSLFTENQILSAQSTGFSSFATPIPPVEFDKQFTVWLMQRVDTMTRTIGPVDKKIMIFQEDAAMVFGVNSSGKEVYDSSLDKSQTMRKEVMSLIGMDDHNSQGKAQRCSLQDLGCTNWTGFER